MSKKYSILQAHLKPISPYLDDGSVAEISLNEAGRVWIERTGSRFMEGVDVPEYNAQKLSRLANAIAAHSNQTITEEQPLLSSLVDGVGRIQLVGPPITETVTFSIRRVTQKKMSLKDYRDCGFFDSLQMTSLNKLSPSNEELLGLYQSNDFYNFFRRAVELKKNIIVSGATSSGKTTFTNALLDSIDPSERIITIEDARELTPCQENHLALVASRGEQSRANVDTLKLLEASLRLRPDRILLGELRGIEAYGFIRAINTGHPGSITTIHADTPNGAINQIALLVLQSGINLEFDRVVDYVSSQIDIVVQLGFNNGTRKIQNVAFLAGGIHE